MAKPTPQSKKSPVQTGPSKAVKSSKPAAKPASSKAAKPKVETSKTPRPAVKVKSVSQASVAKVEALVAKSKVAPRAVAKVPGAVARPPLPQWAQQALAFAQENPATALVGILATCLGLVLLFS
jgi:hypothetical protein